MLNLLKIISFLFLFLNIGVCVVINAQTAMELVRSPQVTDMIRYDNTPVALNSGRLDLNIPLLEISDKDFKFPVMACYNSTGFIPSKPETVLGLNWSLTFGGVIYREVKVIPDDTDGLDKKGFLHFIKDKQSYNPQIIMNNINEHILLAGDIPFFKNGRIEASPDLYHFKFGEYSGTFSIGYDGKINVVSEKGGSLKVDLSDYNFFSSNVPSTFKITADNGSQYYFGGSKDNMEYSINYVNNTGHASDNVYPNAFFLYKIIATNGRELNISYRKIPSYYNNGPMGITDDMNYQKDLKNYTENFIFTGFKNITSTIGNVDYISGKWVISNTMGGSSNYVLTKIALVDEITCGEQKMKFFYSPRAVGKERYKNAALILASRCGAMLDSINLSYDDRPIKNVRFKYSYSNGNNPVFFLSELIMPDNGSYNFLYNKTDQLPNPMDADVDYWNFWRGGIQDGYPIPQITIDSNFDYKYWTDIREPNTEYCDVSLLNKITYPAGGYASITYEPHSYSKRIDRTSASSFMPAILNNESDVIAGGARVSSISYSDINNNLVKRIGYEYTISKSNKHSSGILSYFPRYFGIQRFIIVDNDQSDTLIPLAKPTITYRNTGFNVPSYEQDHVRYSTVREVTVEKPEEGDITYISPVAEYITDLYKLGTVRIEKNVGYWNIIGMKKGGEVDIFIKQNNIIKATLKLKDDGRIRYFPDLESGDYDIYYQKSYMYGFYIQIKKPLEFIGPYKETKFTDYVTNPDRFLDDKAYNKASQYNPIPYEYNDERLAQDCSRERGHIISESSYDINKKLIESKSNVYRSDNQRFESYTLNLCCYYGFMFQLNKTYYYPFLLVQTTHELNIRNGLDIEKITTTTNFEYNDDYLLTKSISRNSRGKEEINIIHYSSDIPNGVYLQMKERNILNIPIEKINIVDNKVTKSELFTYKKNENNEDYVPDKTFVSQLSTPKVYDQFVSYDGNIKDDCYGYSEVEYIRYDRNSNIEEYVSKDCQVKTCVWGYDELYPIAVFENASNTFKLIPKFEDVWTMKWIKLKYPTSYTDKIIYNFQSSKTSDVEFYLVGSLGYNWYIEGDIDGNSMKMVQVRSSDNVGSSWQNYQKICKSNFVFNLSAGDHILNISSLLAYKGISEAERDGDLYFSYWASKSIAPEANGADDAFYENFESLVSGSFDLGFYSERSYIGPYTVSMETNPGREYYIDYRVYKEGKWNYVRHDFVNGTVTVDEGIFPIDDVRVYPKDALISTYSYYPLIGLRSKTNERGITESYEYDSYGRLIVIKDNNEKIISEFCYKYYDR